MIRVGVAGWSYADWRGRVYPRAKPANFSPLVYLSRYLECMELNSSFYAYPSATNCETWEQQLEARDFPFLVKLHRDFTHSPDSHQWGSELDRHTAAFLEALEPLRASGRLRALLVQFPHSFHRTQANRSWLDRIARSFESERLVLELRHHSWFEPQVLDKFASRSLSIATLDLPDARDHPPESHRPSGPIGYLRLHGRNAQHWFNARSSRDQRYDYLYSARELDELATRARKLDAEHDEVYVVANNHFEGQAVANALELRARLTGQKPLAPAVLREAFPHLGAQTESDEPPGLF